MLPCSPIAPAPNTLITVAVLGHNNTSAAPSPTLSGGGMAAWTEVATTTFDGIATPHKRLTIFRAMSATPGSGPLTITFTTGQSNCQWIVSQWDGVDLSGVNGAGAIGQTGTARTDAGSGLSVALGAFGAAANVAYGVFGVTKNVVAVTPGAGFTAIAEQASGESPAADLAAEWAAGDNTIDASWPSAAAAALAVEIRAAGGPSVSAALSTVATSAGSIVAGSGTATITVTAKDGSGDSDQRGHGGAGGDRDRQHPDPARHGHQCQRRRHRDVPLDGGGETRPCRPRSTARRSRRRPRSR